MKQFLQITFAVFFGVLGAELMMDFWHEYQEKVVREASEKLRAEQEKKREEVLEKIRNSIIMQRSGQKLETPNIPPPETFPKDEINGIPGQQ